ncbi:12516_t:CDS:2, partial [Entrophospora sp. SA101]
MSGVDIGEWEFSVRAVVTKTIGDRCHSTRINQSILNGLLKYNFNDEQVRDIQVPFLQFGGTSGQLLIEDLDMCKKTCKTIENLETTHHDFDDIFSEDDDIVDTAKPTHCFTSGGTDKDAYAICKFIIDDRQIALAQSFAKNMGLYGECAGAFSIISESSKEKAAIDSQLKILIRVMYSNPPINGARIASYVLNDPELNKEWLEEEKLWQIELLLCVMLMTFTDQIGMFCYTGLKPEQ